MVSLQKPEILHTKTRPKGPSSQLDTKVCLLRQDTSKETNGENKVFVCDRERYMKGDSQKSSGNKKVQGTFPTKEDPHHCFSLIRVHI